MVKTWSEIKAEGSAHYKNGGVEPIDLYRDIGALRHFALCSIIKYAYRNMGLGQPENDPVSNSDMKKIQHYADILMISCGIEEVNHDC